MSLYSKELITLPEECSCCGKSIPDSGEDAIAYAPHLVLCEKCVTPMLSSVLQDWGALLDDGTFDIQYAIDYFMAGDRLKKATQIFDVLHRVKKFR